MNAQPIAPEKVPSNSPGNATSQFRFTRPPIGCTRINPANGVRELKNEHSQFTVICCEGIRRVKRKFDDIDKGDAKLAAIKLANGEVEVSTDGYRTACV